MRSKESICSGGQVRYKPVFLLAWARFLGYEDLERLGFLEVYDAAVANGEVKTPKEWDRHVIEYNEENVTNALCIAIHRAVTDIMCHDAWMLTVYADDVREWLSMLEVEKIAKKFDLEKYDDVLAFYRKIDHKFDFGINFGNL